MPIIAYRPLAAETDGSALDEAHARVREVAALLETDHDPGAAGASPLLEVAGAGTGAADLGAWAARLHHSPGLPVLRPPATDGTGGGALAVAVGAPSDGDLAARLAAAGWDVLAPASRLGTRAEGRPWDVRTLLGADPGDTAVTDADGASTYRELAALAAEAARRVGPPVDPPRRVLLVGRRDRRTVAGVLGCWLAGAAWCAFEADAPAERRAAVEDQVRPDLVLDCASLTAGTDDAGDLPWTVEPLPPDRMAYLVSSSGSTGTPTVSALPAGGLTPLLDAWRAYYGLRRPQRVCSLAGLEGDVLLGDLLKALSTGGSLHLVPGQGRADPDAVAAVAEEHRCTLLESTPVMVRAVLRRLDVEGGHWPAVTIVGSDTFRAVEARELVTLAAGRTRVVNGYGTTETTIETLVYDCADLLDTREGLCPLGAPLPGVAVAVLDEAGHPVPPGVVGRLCLDTPGALLGRVVAGRPSGRTDGTVDTGDLASLDPDGVLGFHGRSDSMVKVRGFRVELGEVENALLSVPGVAEAFVVAFRRAGATELAAFVAGREVDAGAVRRHLAGRMAVAAVPAEVTVLPALPRLPGGKLDRVAMTERATAAEAPEGRESGGTMADRVARSWSRVLGREPRRDVTFFDHGGTSVLVLALVEDLQAELGEEHRVTAADVFRHPTVTALASALAPDEAPAPHEAAAGEPPGPDEATAGDPAPSAPTRQQVLADLAAGRIQVEEARRLLRADRR